MHHPCLSSPTSQLPLWLVMVLVRLYPLSLAALPMVAHAEMPSLMGFIPHPSSYLSSR